MDKTENALNPYSRHTLLSITLAMHIVVARLVRNPLCLSPFERRTVFPAKYNSHLPCFERKSVYNLW